MILEIFLWLMTNKDISLHFYLSDNLDYLSNRVSEI